MNIKLLFILAACLACNENTLSGSNGRSPLKPRATKHVPKGAEPVLPTGTEAKVPKGNDAQPIVVDDPIEAHEEPAEINTSRFVEEGEARSIEEEKKGEGKTPEEVLPTITRQGIESGGSIVSPKTIIDLQHTTDLVQIVTSSVAELQHLSEGEWLQNSDYALFGAETRMLLMEKGMLGLRVSICHPPQGYGSPRSAQVLIDEAPADSCSTTSELYWSVAADYPFAVPIHSHDCGGSEFIGRLTTFPGCEPSEAPLFYAVEVP